MSTGLESWGFVIAVLGLIIGLLALLRDYFDINNGKWPDYTSNLKRLLSNRKRLFVVAGGLVSVSIVLFVLNYQFHLEFYQQDFESSVGSEWSPSSVDTTPGNNRRFLGSFMNDQVFLSLKDLPPHKSVTLSFDLFIIGSWDGNGIPDKFGPDKWGFAVGTNQFVTTFANNSGESNLKQSYDAQFASDGPIIDNKPRNEAKETNILGYTKDVNNPFSDTVYRITKEIPHDSDTLDVRFFANLSTPGDLNVIAAEKWGLDNVVVVLNR